VSVLPEKPARYIPALSFHWLTPLYDPVLRWVMREETFKRSLVQQAGLQPGMGVLDLGCGTGTLTILVKQSAPGVEMTGLDGDPLVLEIARTKAEKAAMQIAWDVGLAFDLPYPAGNFDRVLASLVFHHLTRPDKQRAFNEAYRVLRPWGELHMVDFGLARTPFMRLAAVGMSRLEEAEDNFKGLLPEMMTRAGFTQVDEIAQYATLFGPLSLYSAVKPLR
jgi:ubiquinone/menaquinone biosynthesis C-methylase UbiE